METRAPSVEDPAGRLVQERFAGFLRNFRAEDAGEEAVAAQGSVGCDTMRPAMHRPGASVLQEYVLQVASMKELDTTTMFVNFLDLMAYDAPLATSVKEYYVRFEPYVRAAIADLVREVQPDFLMLDGEQRQFFVGFYNMGQVVKVRDLRMGLVGALSAFRGTVTRTSEVRPELLYGRFICPECNAPSALIEQQFKYTEPAACGTKDCSNRNRWILDLAKSRFADWQRVRVQENADEIPPGSMPRSIDVILRHGAVDRAKAGDRAVFTGTMIVVPDISQMFRAGQVAQSATRPTRSGTGMAGAPGEGVTGIRALGVRDLSYRTCFLAHSVASGVTTTDISGSTDADYDQEAAKHFTEEERAEFRAMADSGQVYHDLVRSMVPTIHGHTEIKKGILMQLCGGVQKSTAEEGIRLRGDINVCIVGDPSTAKSQFLKVRRARRGGVLRKYTARARMPHDHRVQYIYRFWPRSVYTSGKSASAAGLTASVVKDPDTGEFAIEAGALMLADHGICCIDEFDKMDNSDQVAIHEAMEQQTISVTKAGLQATLNARASILAAANPVFGRYDKTKSLRQNVNISAPIMSRFDLFFIVLDEVDESRDELIARHILNVHQKRTAALADVVYPMERVLNYIKYARTLSPQLSVEAKKAIIRAYQRLRASDNTSAAGSSSYRVTVRQLESMIRLSEALARIHLDPVVREPYVLEAFALIRKSMLRADAADIPIGEEEEGGDPTDGLYADLMQDKEAEAAAAAAIAAATAALDDNAGGSTPVDDPNGSPSRSPSRLAASAAVPADPSQPSTELHGTSADSSAPARKKPRKVVKVTSDKYEHVKRSLALRLREQERADVTSETQRESGEDVDHSYALKGAITEGDLIAWYLEQSIDSIPDEEALVAERKLLRRILKRLIEVDEVLYYALPEQVTDPNVNPDARWVRVSGDYVLPGFDDAAAGPDSAV